jgi:hypothetical protein
MDFLLKPRMFASIFLVGVILHFLGLSFASAAPTKIESNRYCLKSGYGVATSDSGWEYEFFKRFGVIDFKYQGWRFSDVYANPQQPSKEIEVLVTQCNEAIQNQAKH